MQFGDPYYPVTTNDQDLHKHFQNVAGDMVGTHNIKEMPPLMGAEDFSFFAEAIPGYFFFLGMVNETRGHMEPGHSTYYTVNEDVLPYGAALHASLATRYLENQQSNPTTPKSSPHDEL